MTSIRDTIGSRGEAIFVLTMTAYRSPAKPLFRPQFLGEKWPVLDHIVMLEGVGDATPYFFVQVKTTRKGYTREGFRLKVAISAEEVRKLAGYPAPTYLVGIDEVGEKAYIVSVNPENLGSLSSLSTAFPIHEENRRLLWEEVTAFWAARVSPGFKSRFADTTWR
jgi:hypothetical protein